MKPAVKIVLYVLLLAGFLFFGYRAYTAFQKRPAPALPVAPGDAPPPVTTNVAVTNVTETNAARATNVAAAEPSRPSGSTYLGEAMTYGFFCFACLVGLGLLVGRDLSSFAADRAEGFLFNDDLVGVRNPDYEEAEEAWKKGQHLEAIQLMRDYYKKHPHEVYVALRIAEIYEKDLGNALAAALEYEEVLKKKLPTERWGWAAIHLANLYSGKLNKTEQAVALLHRVISECDGTPPAKKSRERLGLPEVTPPAPERSAPAEEAKPELPPEPPGPKLPPGFRRK